MKIVKKLIGTLFAAALAVTTIFAATSNAYAATDISDATVTGYSTEVDYTGNPIMFNLVVSVDGVELVEGTDYEVSYANNTAVGMATITLSGMGAYTGSKILNFNILDSETGEAEMEYDEDEELGEDEDFEADDDYFDDEEPEEEVDATKDSKTTSAKTTKDGAKKSPKTADTSLPIAGIGIVAIMAGLIIVLAANRKKA